MTQKKTEGPTFIVKMKRNALGQIGPVLCWPDGRIVQRQVDCVVENNLDELVRVTVTFYATGDFIQIKEYADGTEQAEPETPSENTGQED